MPTAADIIAAGCLQTRARLLDRALTRLYADEVRDFDITAPQFSLLVAITRNPGASAADIGRVLWIDKSTMSRNLRHLQAAGRIRVER